MIEVQEVFGVSLPVTVAINRSKTFEEMFRAADRDRGYKSDIVLTRIDHSVREKYDLYRRKVTETVEIRGFANERGMNTNTVLRELDTFGVVPASIIHWLAFGALCPDSFDQDPETSVYALGGGYVTEQAERIISKDKLNPSAREVPYIYYYSSIIGVPKAKRPAGPYRKELSAHYITDLTRWKAHRYVFLAVAKQGQG